MYRSATKSGFLDQMTFVQNGIDDVRRTAHMAIDNANNGGSFVELGNDESSGSGDSRTFKPINISLFLKLKLNV